MGTAITFQMSFNANSGFNFDLIDIILAGTRKESIKILTNFEVFLLYYITMQASDRCRFGCLFMLGVVRSCDVDM